MKYTYIEVLEVGTTLFRCCRTSGGRRSGRPAKWDMSDQTRPGSGTGIWTPDVRVWDGRCTTWKSDSSLNYGKSQVWKVYSEANAVNEEDPERAEEEEESFRRRRRRRRRKVYSKLTQ